MTVTSFLRVGCMWFSDFKKQSIGVNGRKANEEEEEGEGGGRMSLSPTIRMRGEGIRDGKFATEGRSAGRSRRARLTLVG